MERRSAKIQKLWDPHSVARFSLEPPQLERAEKRLKQQGQASTWPTQAPVCSQASSVAAKLEGDHLVPRRGAQDQLAGEINGRVVQQGLHRTP